MRRASWLQAVHENDERRPLPAQFHVCRAEIPNDRCLKRIRQCGPVPKLQRALKARGVRDGLTMKADQIDIFKLSELNLVFLMELESVRF